VLIGDVSWILRLTELAREQGAPRLRLIVGASEGLPRRSRQFIEDAWGAQMFMCYGCTEGAGGMECRFRSGYHLNEFSFFFEIVNQDAAGNGELVFTTLDRTTMPLVRYRIGDIAKFLPDACECGIVTRRLSPLRGRSDEIVMLGGEGVDPALFEAILGEVPQVSGNWQVAIRRDGHQDVCELRLELEGGDVADVATQVKDVLRAKFDTTWKDYELGLFDLRFTAVPRGALLHDRKLRRLVDEREPG
jgi:phenylacetate-CoA ligase